MAEKKINNELEMVGAQPDGMFLVKLNGTSYALNESQYKAIKRKQAMPSSRLEIWLKSYADENV